VSPIAAIYEEPKLCLSARHDRDDGPVFETRPFYARKGLPPSPFEEARP
jgi:hypothetical protein